MANLLLDHDLFDPDQCSEIIEKEAKNLFYCRIITYYVIKKKIPLNK